jgi:hypothetical protein
VAFRRASLIFENRRCGIGVRYVQGIVNGDVNYRQHARASPVADSGLNPGSAGDLIPIRDHIR